MSNSADSGALSDPSTGHLSPPKLSASDPNPLSEETFAAVHSVLPDPSSSDFTVDIQYLPYIIERMFPDPEMLTLIQTSCLYIDSNRSRKVIYFVEIGKNSQLGGPQMATCPKKIELSQMVCRLLKSMCR
ncbi:hypothetical protein T265_08956 [Opisthorchis viverrini]|uniref:Uncharacterized protein n=1 Tax=Opisthorchis viverrini TaxID=6198 RepID=A0A074ZIG4_OPIVI|nr:hypothetical protein T265_08956 [Opisthorchis viverrini]KER23105.1 hypothetical protein T265_08956 [Opisthorchis viverrini]